MSKSHGRQQDRVFDASKARAKMKEAGKSYADLARALGMKTRQAPAHWFRGRGEPEMRQLKAVAAELGCHWLELVKDDAVVVYDQVEKQRLGRLRALTPEELDAIDRLLAMKTATVPKE